VIARQRIKSARESLREMGRGLSPRYQPGSEALVIDELVSPLRYDVLVRSQLFELLAAERACFDRSPDAFVDLARQTDYHRWFTVVAVHAIGIAGQPEPEIEAAFHRRVLRSAALADSVAAKGFIPKPPLTVRVTAEIDTATGKHLGRRHYPLDGCHRLALLRALGRAELLPGEYRVTAGRGPLLDNTATLIRALGLDASRYLSFLASGYGLPAGGSWDEPEALVETVERRQPERAAELRSVLAADLPALASS
jgi:hypothetical protein